MTVQSRRSVLGLLGAAPVAAGGLLAAAGTAEPSGTDRMPRDLLPGGRFDQFVAERAAADQFSGTVLVAQQGRPVLTRSHRLANIDRAVANRPDTSFNLASVTKCFTAVAVGQLAQQGRAAFHKPLGTYLDGFPADVAQATVHQLLTHTAGVGRPALTTERPPGEGEWVTVDEVWNGTLAYLRTRPLRFTPGSQFGYSNDGYFVLGAIVAAVSGLSYYDYVRRNVFVPAGMTDTDFYTKPQILADDSIARAYATLPTRGRVDLTTMPFVPYIGGPAGGAYSSAPDLLRFATALHAGRLLNSAFTHVVTGGKVALDPSTAVSSTPGQIALLYGYGHVDGIVGDRRVVGHSGSGLAQANNPDGSAGWITNLDVFPAVDRVVVILSNYWDSSIGPIVNLAREIITGR